jgi:hypothetical protein
MHDPAFLKDVSSGAEVIVSALPAIGDEGGLGASVAALVQAAEV